MAFRFEDFWMRDIRELSIAFVLVPCKDIYHFESIALILRSVAYIQAHLMKVFEEKRKELFSPGLLRSLFYGGPRNTCIDCLAKLLHAWKEPWNQAKRLWMASIFYGMISIE